MCSASRTKGKWFCLLRADYKMAHDLIIIIIIISLIQDILSNVLISNSILLFKQSDLVQRMSWYFYCKKTKTLFSFAAWDSFLWPQTLFNFFIFFFVLIVCFWDGGPTCPPKKKLILCYSAMSFLYNTCFSFFEWLFSFISNVAAEYIYLLKFFCANNLFWLQWLLHSCIKVKYRDGPHCRTQDNTQIWHSEISTQSPVQCPNN